VAALFTEDGVLVAPDGIFSGRQAIEKRYEDTFQRWPFTLFNDLRDCHLKAIDNAVWSFGEWGVLFKTRLVPCSSKATFHRFMFVRVMIGRSGRSAC
jgi:ketosteroid isomerase-like protein